MCLTKDEIAVIKHAADLLEGWLKDLIGNKFGYRGCYIPLQAYYETYIVKAMDILILKKPPLGLSIKAECDELLMKAKSFSSMDEEDSSEFTDKETDLGLLARRIIPRFRVATHGKWRIKVWIKNHPHSNGLAGSIIFLMLFFVLGLVKAQWRNWCWGTAGVALLVLILSLLGGRSSR